MKIFILVIVFLSFITGCSDNKELQIEDNKDNSKIILKLQKFDDIADNEKYESSMVVKSENINISGIKYENIDKGMLYEYEEKYSKVIQYIKHKYSNFDTKKWNIIVNMFSASDGNGIIKFNYQIKDEIDTNKSILLNVSDNVINKISFINMNFEVDEEKMIKLVNEFKNNIIQEKKEFLENEEFLSEDTKYIYYYNVDELRYTYQLYFYVKYGDNPEHKVVNNDYGCEYVINKNEKLKI